MKNKIIIQLFRFMRVFDIQMFSLLTCSNNQIRALVAWKDDCQEGIPIQEETQEIFWEYPAMPNIEDALLIAEYAYDKGWISIDKITVPKSELIKSINWSTDRFDKALHDLLNIKIKMIDDGNENDSFSIHF